MRVTCISSSIFLVEQKRFIMNISCCAHGHLPKVSRPKVLFKKELSAEPVGRIATRLHTYPRYYIELVYEQNLLMTFIVLCFHQRYRRLVRGAYPLPVIAMLLVGLYNHTNPVYTFSVLQGRDHCLLSVDIPYQSKWKSIVCRSLVNK